MKDVRDRFPIYSKLLKLYPKNYRERYEEEILLTTSDMLENSKTFSEKVAIWSSLALDLPLNIARQNFNYIGGTMHNNMPNYVKRNSLISALLLLPFFIAIAANGIDKLLNNSNLYNSWLWHNPAIILWVFYLPALAFIISFASYSLFVFKGTNKNRIWVKRAMDLLHSWPLLIVGIIAFGILFLIEFHDSTQCVVRSPIHAVSNVSQTFHCVETNRSIIPRHDFQL